MFNWKEYRKISTMVEEMVLDIQGKIKNKYKRPFTRHNIFVIPCKNITGTMAYDPNSGQKIGNFKADYKYEGYPIFHEKTDTMWTKWSTYQKRGFFQDYLRDSGEFAISSWTTRDIDGWKGTLYIREDITKEEITKFFEEFEKIADFSA